jgi:hypothetical protein
MNMSHSFETLTDRDLETVAGGLSFSIDFSKGISIDSKILGKQTIAFPKPSDVLAGLKSTISTTLDNAGKLLDLGQLFDFI